MAQRSSSDSRRPRSASRADFPPARPPRGDPAVGVSKSRRVVRRGPMRRRSTLPSRPTTGSSHDDDSCPGRVESLPEYAIVHEHLEVTALRILDDPPARRRLRRSAYCSGPYPSCTQQRRDRLRVLYRGREDENRPVWIDPTNLRLVRLEDSVGPRGVPCDAMLDAAGKPRRPRLPGHLGKLVVVQQEVTAVDGPVIRQREHVHPLQFGHDIFGIVAGKCAGIEPSASVPLHKPGGFLLVASSIRSRGKPDQGRLVFPRRRVRPTSCMTDVNVGATDR